MTKDSKNINNNMFKLLIEKEMDNFSVVELRDALVQQTEGKYSQDEARKYVYRQILAYVKKGWLTSKGQNRLKLYLKTDSFKSLSFSSSNTTKTKELTNNKQQMNDEIKIFVREKSNYTGELEIILGEVEEYQSLMSRFPSMSSSLRPLFEVTKDRSARLLGKINALSNVIKLSKTGIERC
jgi:hypothetical protein